MREAPNWSFALLLHFNFNLQGLEVINVSAESWIKNSVDCADIQVFTSLAVAVEADCRYSVHAQVALKAALRIALHRDTPDYERCR